MNKLPRRILSIALAGGLVVGGAAGWSYYRSGSNYHPDSSSAALKQNNVVFPSQEQDVASDGKTADDSAWEQDQNAENSRRPENSANTEQSIQLPANFTQTQLDTSIAPEQTPQPDDATEPDTSVTAPPDNTYIVTPDDPSNPDNVLPTIPELPSVPSGSTDSSDGRDDNTNVIIPGGDSSDGSVIIIPGGGNKGDGTPSEPDKPSVPDKPDAPGNEVPDSEVPAAPDVVIHPGLLPEDPFKSNGFGGKDFDSDAGIPNKNNSGSTGGNTGDSTGGNTGSDTTDEPEYTYSFTSMTGEASTQLTRFYIGQPINAADFFQACYFYIIEKPASGIGQSYRITDYGENFRIGSFPETAPDGSFSVTFYYRLNPGSPWYKDDVTFNVVRCELRLVMNYDYRNLDLDTAAEDDEDYIAGQPIRIYPDVGDNTYDLSRYFYRMQPEELWRGTNSAYEDKGTMAVRSAADKELTELFPGWSETPGGELVGNTYTVSADATGLIELYPADMVDVPEGYTAELKAEIRPLLGGDQDNNGGYSSQFYQMITALPEDESEFDIPEGSQILALDDTIYASSVILPSTLLKITDIDPIMVFGSISVRDGNSAFVTENGMLYNADKTELLTFSSALETLVIPASVTTFHYPNGSYPDSITFLGSVPPELDLDRLPYSCKVYVPESGEVAFFAALYEQLAASTSFTLYTLDADNNATPCTLQNKGGLILSEDGTTLLAVLPTVKGICSIPGTVETIASGALNAADGVTTIIVPASVKTIEENALNNENLTSATFAGATPPTLCNNALPDNVTISVSPENVDTYQKTWGNTADVQPKLFYLYHKDGWSYMMDVAVDEVCSVTLLDVPTDLTHFDEDVLKAAIGDDVEITAIGDYAFSNCNQLTMVILPDSISSIGQYAFYDCTALEGIYSARKDFISLNEKSFWIGDASYITGSLRFVALNCLSTDMGDVYSVSYPFFVPDEGEGYPELHSVNRFGPSYILEKNPEGGYVLYSEPRLHSEDDGFAAPGTYGTFLLSATTDITGTVTLAEDTLKINDNAFVDCKKPFTLANTDDTFWIGQYAFAYSTIVSTSFVNVEIIESYAFASCPNLTTLDLSQCSFLTYIGESAFNGSGLQHIVFGENYKEEGDDVSDYKLQIGMNAFANTADLQELTLPDYTSFIGSGMLTGSALGVITLQSADAPTITTYSLTDQGAIKCIYVEDPIWGRFTTAPDTTFKVILAGKAAGHELDYIKAWRETMGSFSYQTGERDILEGENLVRGLFNMNTVETPTDFSTDLPDLPDLPDGNADDRIAAADPVVTDAGTPETDPEPDAEPAPDSETETGNENAPAPDASNAGTQPAPADDAGAEEGETE